MQMIESSLDPDVSAYVSEVLADETSELSIRTCEARMPFTWTFASDPAVCRRAKAGAGDAWAELAGSVFHVYFRCCSAAERLVFIGQSAPGAEPLDSESLFYCHGLAQLLFDQFSLCSPVRGGTSIRVTARERECLRWCAEGKTSEEIGIILSLSTHTVNHYLISATKKLNAVNRMHAITIAIRHGILDINAEP
ncbi:helix-turn-helix transcriptional regulator [Oricola thermophila]|uniref:Helix-turn-helix domain-containing protein n=1 Tax=Oricola thermophila TaxID=2742145 RepID=A0A6N1VFJ3_9HYPH|nr:helix-turn-helix domain-containing protein [Oricola thermophila]QKV19614.1 helix-turn-helix domain-containing protein [Oricola thermophila]